MAIALLGIIAKKFELQKIVSEVSWWQATAPSQRDSGLAQQPRTSEESGEEEEMHRKRYFAQCLHKIQSAPGFLDLARLCLSIVSTVLGSDGIGNEEFVKCVTVVFI